MRVTIVHIHREHVPGPTGNTHRCEADVLVRNLWHERMLERIDGITVRIESRIGCAMDVITHGKHGAHSGASILREPWFASELRNGPKLLGTEILKAITRSSH